MVVVDDDVAAAAVAPVAVEVVVAAEAEVLVDTLEVSAMPRKDAPFPIPFASTLKQGKFL